MKTVATLSAEKIMTGRPTVSLFRRLAPWRVAGVMLREIQGLHRARYVIANLVVTQLKIRYQRSALGFFWTLLNPVLMLTVQGVVFSIMLHQPFKAYVVYLFSGLIPWQFFATSLDAGSRSLLANEYLIRKIAAPKIIFPLSEVLVAAVNLVFSIVALFVIFALMGSPVTIQLVLLPVGIIFLTLFSFGLALVAMTLVTFFRDFIHIIQVFLAAFYFLCPILIMMKDYRPYEHYFRMNPMYYLLDFFHASLWGGYWPDAVIWERAALSSFGALAFGYFVYKLREHEYIFRL